VDTERKLQRTFALGRTAILKRFISISVLFFGAVGSWLAGSESAKAATILFDFKNDPSFPASGHVTTLPTTQNPHTFASETSNPGWTISAAAKNYSTVNYSDNISLSPAYNTTPSVTLPLTHQYHVPDFSSATIKTSSPFAQLTLKNEGTGETGLGMVPDPNNNFELTAGKTITLDFSSLYTQATAENLSITDISFVISSAQVNEGFLLYGSSTQSSLAGVSIAGNSKGKLLGAAPGGTSNSGYTIDIPAKDLFNDFIFTAYGTGNNKNPNVLIQSVTVGTTGIVPHNGPVPEPASALIWSVVAIVGAAGKHFRDRRAATRMQRQPG
jgi:hypothetical protein